MQLHSFITSFCIFHEQLKANVYVPPFVCFLKDRRQKKLVASLKAKPVCRNSIYTSIKFSKIVLIFSSLDHFVTLTFHHSISNCCLRLRFVPEFQQTKARKACSCPSLTPPTSLFPRHSCCIKLKASGP